ncbi:MAG: hypothetical protein ACRDRU_14550 [Pseudonocardiaceae bacterium]
MTIALVNHGRRARRGAAAGTRPAALPLAMRDGRAGGRASRAGFRHAAQAESGALGGLADGGGMRPVIRRGASVYQDSYEFIRTPSDSGCSALASPRVPPGRDSRTLTTAGPGMIPPGPVSPNSTPGRAALRRAEADPRRAGTSVAVPEGCPVRWVAVIGLVLATPCFVGAV